VHDHGSWGVVGVVEGVLEERSYVRMSPDRWRRFGHRPGPRRHGAPGPWRGDELRSEPGPHPRDGRPEERSRAVSLHLYGRTMSNFNIYDVAARSRRRIEVAHNES
jgi:hypothetical protein